jgi:hypothetical protein
MSEQKSAVVVSTSSSELIRLIKEYNIKVFAHFVKMYLFHKGFSSSKDYVFPERFDDVYGNHHKVLCKCEYCFGLEKSVEFDRLFQAESDFQIEFAKIRLRYNDLDFYSREPIEIAKKVIYSKFA